MQAGCKALLLFQYAGVSETIIPTLEQVSVDRENILTGYRI